jgi:hypothetical protein
LIASAGGGLVAIYWFGLGVAGFFAAVAAGFCLYAAMLVYAVFEVELAIKLFNRERQRLIITEAGRDYLTVVRDALDRIAVGTERLLQRHSTGALTVSTSPDFAAKWLGRTRTAVSAMCVRALRITVLKSAGNFTGDECHDLNAEKIQRVKCFMSRGAEFVAC